MELTQLQYFKMVADLKSFTKAAETLYTTQPALSRAINSLEVELGVKVFDRKGRTIELNQNGVILLKYTKTILNALNGVKDEVKDLNGNYSSAPNIVLKIALAIMPDIITEFMEKYPNTILNIMQHHQDRWDTYDLDISIFNSDKIIDEKNTVLLFDEEIVLAVNKNNKLNNLETVYLKDIKDEKFISVLYDSGIANAIDKIFRESAFKPNIIMEMDNYLFIKQFITKEIGVSLVPSISYGYYNDPNIRLINIEDLKIPRYVYLSWSKVKYISKSAIIFKDFLIEYFENLKKIM